MACFNCGSCKKVVQLIPVCYSGLITICKGLTIGNSYFLQVFKSNGAMKETKLTADASGQLSGTLEGIFSDLDFFRPGSYKFQVVDTNREVQTVQDFTTGTPIEATCFVMKIADFEQDGLSSINFIFE